MYTHVLTKTTHHIFVYIIRVTHLYLLPHCNIYKSCSIDCPENHTPNVDEVWSILPALESLPSRGSNSDAGKIDQTWSTPNVSIISIYDSKRSSAPIFSPQRLTYHAHIVSLLLYAMKKKKQILSSSWFAVSDVNMVALNGQYAQSNIFCCLFNCNIFVSNTMQKIFKP